VSGRRRRLWSPSAFVGVALAVLVAGALLSPSGRRDTDRVLLYVVLAESWNLIGGFAGYVSLGQVAFFGLGGYATGVLMARAGLPFEAALAVGTVLAGLFALALGPPLLRLRGPYFAIASLGVAEGLAELMTNLVHLTGGGAGLTIPAFGPSAPTAYPSSTVFFVAFWALALCSVGLVALTARSRLGFGLRAIREDEGAAASLGVRTNRAKTLALVLSAVLASLGGGLWAFQEVVIFPDRVFSLSTTVLVIVMVVLGGSGTVVGPVVGAAVLEGVADLARGVMPGGADLVLGLAIVLAVLFVPNGVLGLGRRLAVRLRQVRRVGVPQVRRLASSRAVLAESREGDA